MVKEMPMSRIYLDRKIIIPSAKLVNNRCTSSGEGKTVVPLTRYTDLGARFCNR